MKVVNPIGRNAEAISSAHNDVIMACMCGTWSNFSATRTTDDTCRHCGCNCYDSSGEETKYRTNNFSTASSANRATPGFQS